MGMICLGLLLIVLGIDSHSGVSFGLLISLGTCEQVFGVLLIVCVLCSLCSGFLGWLIVVFC